MSSTPTQDTSVKKWFGKNLAELLSEKISVVYPDFDSKSYINHIADEYQGKNYSELVELHALALQIYLPSDYKKSLALLLKILGPENQNETGMFTHFYWVLPIAKFIEKYGIEFPELSLHALGEVTKRSTSEYAIRPYIEKYPKKSLKKIMEWAQSDNVHLRRLASEGIRPKLPWAKKLTLFIENPKPVFAILELLMEDSSKFVQKSVANNIRDYLKVNKPAAVALMQKYQSSENKYTQWILKHAARKGISVS